MIETAPTAVLSTSNQLKKRTQHPVVSTYVIHVCVYSVYRGLLLLLTFSVAKLIEALTDLRQL